MTKKEKEQKNDNRSFTKLAVAALAEKTVLQKLRNGDETTPIEERILTVIKLGGYDLTDISKVVFGK